MAKPYLKTVHQETTNYVDPDTGELVDAHIKNTKIVVNDRTEFIQLYISIESKLLGLSLSEERVLLYALLNCDNKNIVHISAYGRKEIAKSWGLADSTVYNALAVLHKEGLLVKIEKGTFRVNPSYAWKGNSTDRTTMLKHFLSVECTHC